MARISSRRVAIDRFVFAFGNKPVGETLCRIMYYDKGKRNLEWENVQRV